MKEGNKKQVGWLWVMLNKDFVECNNFVPILTLFFFSLFTCDLKKPKQRQQEFLPMSHNLTFPVSEPLWLMPTWPDKLGKNYQSAKGEPELLAGD